MNLDPMVVIVFFHCIFFEHFQSGKSSGAFRFVLSPFSSSFSFRQRAFPSVQMSHTVTATSTGFIKFFDLLLSGEEEHKLFEDFTKMCHDDSMDLEFSIETGEPSGSIVAFDCDG